MLIIKFLRSLFKPDISIGGLIFLFLISYVSAYLFSFVPALVITLFIYTFVNVLISRLSIGYIMVLCARLPLFVKYKVASLVMKLYTGQDISVTLLEVK